MARNFYDNPDWACIYDIPEKYYGSSRCKDSDGRKRKKNPIIKGAIYECGHRVCVLTVWEDRCEGFSFDSLISIFYTRNGRNVKDGGGITPDIIIKNNEVSEISISLMNKRLVFDFATQFRYKNEKIALIENFEITDEIFNNFVEFLSDKEYQYTTATEDALDILKETTDEEGISDLITEEFHLLKEKITLNKENDLTNNKKEIKEFLSNEIVSRYHYQEGRIIDRLKNDKEIDEALRLFQNINEYHYLLNPNK